MQVMFLLHSDGCGDALFLFINVVCLVSFLNWMFMFQICIVYSIELKSWCRAFVESLFLSTDGYHAMCFLVDKAERIVVKADE